MERFGDKVQCNPSVKLKKGNSYPLVSIDKIVPGYKNVVSDEFITYTGQSGCKFQDKDVLMARITPCLENGKLAVAKTDGEKGLGSTELFVFRGIDNVSDTNYIYYLLCMPYMRGMAINSMTGASGRQRADIGFIKKIPWTYPSLEIQQRIVNILSHYDNLIENNNKRIKILEQMAENLYKEWFVRFRFPGHETAEFVDGVPKGWKVVELHSYVDIKAGGDRPEICKDTPDDMCNVPVYSNGVNNNGLYGYTTDAVIDKESITISARGTVGFVCLRRQPFVPIVRLLSLTPTKEDFSATYLYYLLKQDELIGNGTSQQQITIPMVKKKKVLKPALYIVSRFSLYAKELWDEIDILQKQNQNLIKQRDYLLPRLMSGKLQVK